MISHKHFVHRMKRLTCIVSISTAFYALIFTLLAVSVSDATCCPMVQSVAATGFFLRSQLLHTVQLFSQLLLWDSSYIHNFFFTLPARRACKVTRISSEITLSVAHCRHTGARERERATQTAGRGSGGPSPLSFSSLSRL